MIPQNEALKVSFSKKLVKGQLRSSEVTQGQKRTKKGRISIFSRRQIISQNEALELIIQR